MFRSIAALLLLAPFAGAEPLRIVSWNVESGGNDPGVIAEQLADLGRLDAYCLQEVSPSYLGRYADAVRQAHGRQYRYIGSSLGANDRLLIVFDAERLDLLESREMFMHGEHTLNDWRHRSPLAMVMRDKQTGAEFILMTVHLARGSARLRREQAEGLREWAKAQERPVIAVGDFNFDFDFPSQRGNRAFQVFTEGRVWRWVRPPALIDTNWADSDGDGVDDYPDSCLDFAFASGGGLSGLEAGVIVRDGDFPDDDRTSDHRPVTLEAIINP